MAASIQIMKSSFSFCQKGADFNIPSCRKRRFIRVPYKRGCFKPFVDVKMPQKIYCKIQESDNQNKGEEPPESLFMKELRRRGMTPTSLLEETKRSVYEDGDNTSKEEERGASSRNAVSTDSGRNLFNQREQSMALNSEGLEGLIPRAKLLLRLGGTFFLAFWPLIIVTIAFTSAMYLYFGPAFIHDGRDTPITQPQYIDPYDLLEEERISKVAPPRN
ncbi:hypothetical protein LIER_22511 [Lithospermum erythrorhizon]|uniref:Tubulin alpha-6 chain n=1 Tax=Lithospermum erythrorhizon TaxID=34254 RepID=A0AAV3QX81_LITER